MMKGVQKFNKGDLVQIAKDLEPWMSHFTSNCRAIVIGSYAEQYGGDDCEAYTLFLEGRGKCSWYKEHQLTLLEAGRLDLLEQWKNEREEEIKLKGNLDWIFANGLKVLNEGHGASIGALAKCFGLNDLWGCNGEGVTYYKNATLTLNMALSFLEAGDKDGWIEFCNEIIRQREGE